MREDARVSASEIARKTGANERTIRKRIEWLVEAGVVRFAAIIDPQALGYVIAADVFLEVEPPGKEDEVLKILMAVPEVIYAAYGNGTNDITISVSFKDNDGLRDFIRHTLANIPGVTLTRYAFVPRILRNVHDWMPPKDDFVSG